MGTNFDPHFGTDNFGYSEKQNLFSLFVKYCYFNYFLDDWYERIAFFWIRLMEFVLVTARQFFCDSVVLENKVYSSDNCIIIMYDNVLF